MKGLRVFIFAVLILAGCVSDSPEYLCFVEIEFLESTNDLKIDIDTDSLSGYNIEAYLANNQLIYEKILTDTLLKPSDLPTKITFLNSIDLESETGIAEVILQKGNPGIEDSTKYFIVKSKTLRFRNKNMNRNNFYELLFEETKDTVYNFAGFSPFNRIYNQY